uniref:Uncharacterized protein n=1 Tax=Tanacetum cinerariifolium TaxID=118510 RepID=A0A6L2K593_TANCI|nr:hypothetical protein [Tanacetum cinerariifolium]
MAQQVIPAAQLVPRFHTIGRCNNYAVLQSIPCSPECKIIWQILLDHPLSYALTAIADVLDMFRYLLHLLVETPKNPFVAPVNIEIIEVFMNNVGYQSVVDKGFHEQCESEEGSHPEIYATDDFKESTPRAYRKPTLTGSPQGKKRKQIVRESSSPHKSLKITIRQQKVVKREKDNDESADRLEPGIHKDNLKHVDDDDDKDGENVNEEEGGEMGSLETRTEEMQTPIPTKHRFPRTILSLNKNITQDLMNTKCVTTKQFWKTHKQVNQVLHEGVSQLAKKATEDLIKNNLKPCIVATIIEDHDAFRSELPDLVSQESNAQSPKIIEELFNVQSNVIQVHPTITT